jgi:RNA polymerase sigma factor (sigma-70 family)
MAMAAHNSLNASSQPVIDWPTELSRHGRWLRAVLLARSRELRAVEELFQQLSLIVVRQAAPLRDASRVAPWLYRTAVRVALLHRRQLGRQRRLQAAIAERIERKQDDSANNPLDWLLMVERNQLIRQALDSLPTREAEMLVLKYTEDWSYRELAASLGISESAVEARLHRARQKLRAELTRRRVIEVG